MILKIFVFVVVVCGSTSAQNNATKLACFYDSSSYVREGLGKLLNPDLDIALQFCTHLIYGYAGINPDTFQVFSLNQNLDIDKHQYSEVISLKRKYPHLKVLLSVGGDADVNTEETNKYIKLLESEKVKQIGFINTALSMVQTYGFDGLDLAYQFPRNKPRKVHSDIGMVWKQFKKLFTGNFIVDTESDQHKEQFTSISRDLKNILRPNGLLLSLTVLPNVNASWYFDIPAISSTFDFINLGTFDFVTPGRNPAEADFTAPIYEVLGENRLPHYNLNFQVEHWLQSGCPANKINIGVATYGRAWKLTKDSGSNGEPPVPNTDGPASPGLQSQKPGLLSWPEICAKLPNPSNTYLKGSEAPLRRITDGTKRYGTFAFRAADENGDHGIWVSYDDPDTAANKASYARSKALGGLALFDLSYDDFRGLCTGDKYPILRAAKYRL